MGMKEKEVGVASDCNTTPSSAWLIPLSHSWIFKDVVGSTEDAAPDSVKVANVALSICRAEVGVPAGVAGGSLGEPRLVRLGRVSLPSTDVAPGDPLPRPLVPTKVALFGDHTCSLHHIVLLARLAGAKASTLGWFSQLWGLGGGTVHPII